MPAEFRDQIEMCSRVGDAGIRNARLEETSRDREKYWRYWKNFCGIMGVDPHLDPQLVTWNEKARTCVSFGGSGKDFVAMVNKSLAEQLAKRSPPLARRSPWNGK